eukprot:7211612-Prymnesium_polylepis.1
MPLATSGRPTLWRPREYVPRGICTLLGALWERGIRARSASVFVARACAPLTTVDAAAAHSRFLTPHFCLSVRKPHGTATTTIMSSGMAISA